MPHSKPYEFFFGPPYSGHQPAFGDASWHALVYGRKRWFIWPPDHGFYSTSNTYDFVRTGIQIPAGGMDPLQCVMVRACAWAQIGRARAARSSSVLFRCCFGAVLAPFRCRFIIKRLRGWPPPIIRPYR